MSTEELDYERYQQKVWEKNHPQCAAKLVACERQVNELAEINKELLSVTYAARAALLDANRNGYTRALGVLEMINTAIAKAEK